MLLADRDFITRAIKSKSAFPLLYNNNIITINKIIPSIKILAKDFLYLEDYIKVMRTLINLIECYIREII
ncbi:hypothetical protein LAWI1_G008349 [Lachnellula willkommii]|uniref:Uncharacterized protein n=1 Tax=Lachnellula willkommii TaxID=215461 RepID=A0A559M8B4_9HELO|nr:hypothetical protein LAWI1_G008349 [Lachnellula willkommii]